MKSAISEINEVVVSDEGKEYWITTATVEAAPERARAYLEAVLKWAEEFATHLAPLLDAPQENDYHEQYGTRFSRLLVDAHLPEGIWFPTEEGFTEDHMEDLIARIESWVNGELANFDGLYDDLDEDFDLDPTYILFGVPVRQLSVEDQRRLRRLGRAVGSGG